MKTLEPLSCVCTSPLALFCFHFEHLSDTGFTPAATKMGDSSFYQESDPLLPQDGNQDGRPKADLPHASPKGWKRFILEPVIFFYLFAIGIQTIDYQFAYHVFAKELTRNSTSNLTEGLQGSVSNCDTNTSSPQFILQQKIQDKTAQFSIYQSVLYLGPMMISVIIFGSFSDKIGRKLPLLLAISSEVPHFVLFLLVIYFDLPIWITLIGNFIVGVTGGINVVFMASYAFISDITTAKDRTLRIVVLDAVLGLGATGGLLVSGYMLNSLGFAACYWMMTGIFFFIALYIQFVVPETVQKRTSSDVSGSKRLLVGFKLFSKSHNPQNWWKLLLCIITFFCLFSADSSNQGTLFLLNSPLCWGPKLIGIFFAVKVASTQLGGMAFAFIMKKCISDKWVALMGIVSAIAGLVWLGLSTTTLMVFLVPIVGVAGTICLSLIRSIMSRAVSQDSQGALFSILGLVQTFIGLSSTYVFNTIYEHTLYDVRLHGLVFIIQGALSAVGLIFFVVYIYKTRTATAEDEPGSPADTSHAPNLEIRS